MRINGVDIVGQANNTPLFIELVNSFSNSTGVSARLKPNSATGQDVEFYATDGRAIQLEIVSVSLAQAISVAISTVLVSNGIAAHNDFARVLKNGIASTALNAAGDSFNTFTAGSLGGAFSRIFTGMIELRSSEAIILAGSNTANAFGFSDTVVAVDQSVALANIQLSTQPEAQDALAYIDATLQQLTQLRANLGAIQNRLDAVVNSLSITNENLSSAQAEIRDADMAVEVAELTRAQILQQAGVAVLGQANVSAQIALSLLQF